MQQTWGFVPLLGPSLEDSWVVYPQPDVATRGRYWLETRTPSLPTMEIVWRGSEDAHVAHCQSHYQRVSVWVEMDWGRWVEAAPITSNRLHVQTKTEQTPRFCQHRWNSNPVWGQSRVCHAWPRDLPGGKFVAEKLVLGVAHYTSNMHSFHFGCLLHNEDISWVVFLRCATQAARCRKCCFPTPPPVCSQMVIVSGCSFSDERSLLSSGQTDDPRTAHHRRLLVLFTQQVSLSSRYTGLPDSVQVSVSRQRNTRKHGTIGRGQVRCKPPGQGYTRVPVFHGN